MIDMTTEPTESGRSGAGIGDFELTVVPLTGDLYRRAYAYTRNAADAEDLVQETLFKAYRAFGTVGSDCRLNAWLLSIMRNTWISSYRATVRRPAETLVGDLTDGQLEAASGYASREALSAEHLALGDMASPEVVAALSALPEPLRLTLYYVAVLELTCHEVAAVMGVPKGTVMSRMYRGRRRLRRALEKSAAGGGTVTSGRVAPPPVR